MLVTIPLYDKVDVLDVTGPFEIFSWAGFDVVLTAQTAGLVRCRGGIAVEAPQAFADAAKPDVIWIPGGDPDSLKQIITSPDQTYLDFIASQAADATIVASVCEGAMLLAAAGLLDGYEATTHWAFTPCFAEMFPKVKVVAGHPRYHLDRNRLTGGGISSGLDEALFLVSHLLGTETAEKVQQVTQYYPQPPVSSQIPPATSCPLTS